MDNIQEPNVYVKDIELTPHGLLVDILTGDTMEKRIDTARELKELFKELQIIK